jgi:histidyl-tRNA synthetase
MGNQIRSVKGTRDLLPPESGIWAAVEDKARAVFSLFGYREIRTPILESTELFVRSVGETTDIVGKEMYSFEDRKGRSLSMRPESTASVVRAFVQHGLQMQSMPVKLFYTGPHFRYERPQKGRYRQFHQIGAELIGDPGPESDAELLAMLVRFLEELGFDDLTVLLHTVGDEESRIGYRERLQAFFEPLRDRLSTDSQRRLDTNPLRILDSKHPGDVEIMREAPRLEDHLNVASRQHFDGVRGALEQLGVPFAIAEGLVRGLDYYTHTVFEIVSGGLGSQNAIVGGGRYDRLIADLGGPDLPAIGFAIGQDRLIEVLPVSFRDEMALTPPVVVVVIEPVSVLEGLLLANELRDAEVPAVSEFKSGSVRSALKRADRRGARWVLLVGEDEQKAGTVMCRDMERGSQQAIVRQEVAARLREMA